MASCCIVPNDLQDFANEHKIKILTHNDPGVLIDGDKLKNIKPENCIEEVATLLNEGQGQLDVDWVVRYQVMDGSRGVLKDKRYIIALKS